MDRQLIYDVGANNGNDTAHYLAKGFRVVAIEANPLLAGDILKRFAAEVDDGRLDVLTVGVAEERGVFDFFINETNDELSSFDREAGTRFDRFHTVEVECRTFGDILTEYGTPYYLKIDIERADINCIRELNPIDLPMYVSIEAQSVDYLTILSGHGYRQFKVIDQSTLNRPRSYRQENPFGQLATLFNHHWCRVKRHTGWGDNPFPVGSSGAFAEETPGDWRSMDDVAYDWMHFHLGRRGRGTLNPHGWYDFHAKF
jgi:FkbM family methyltransferase